MPKREYDYTKLAISCLKHRNDSNASLKSIEYSLFNSSTDPWGALSKAVEKTLDIAVRAASYGFSAMVFNVFGIEEKNFSDTIKMFASWKYEIKDPSTKNTVRVGIGIGKKTADKFKTLGRSGLENARTFISNYLYENLAAPNKISCLDMDIPWPDSDDPNEIRWTLADGICRWIPTDFDLDQDGSDSTAKALEEGVPYEDVFAAYNLKSIGAV